MSRRDIRDSPLASEGPRAYPVAAEGSVPASVVIGGGPAGLTVALLLARAGHRVTVVERAPRVGGLWATNLDADGHYLGENSCKVYQPTYHSAPALFALLGTRWEEHFVPRHDLAHDWLRAFVADSSWRDLARIGRAWGLYATGLRSFRDVSVGEWLEANGLSEPCRNWMRATALGGVTGTLRMTMWEFLYRLHANAGSLLHGGGGALYWNARPPNAADGFVTQWAAALSSLGVEVRTGVGVRALETRTNEACITMDDGSTLTADAAFLALPPRALAQLLEASPSVSSGFGQPQADLLAVIRASRYEHLGVTWTFDRPLPRDLPLGGHNVRRGWHPILVQYSQYRAHLRPPAVTAVLGSISLDTDLRHARLGTCARDHAPEELARILWADERLVDPSLPEPIGCSVYGLSDATQLLAEGPLPLRCTTGPVYVATNMSGAAAYFTASLESAIQAGAAAALAFDPQVERLPTGSEPRGARIRSFIAGGRSRSTAQGPQETHPRAPSTVGRRAAEGTKGGDPGVFGQGVV